MKIATGTSSRRTLDQSDRRSRFTLVKEAPNKRAGRTSDFRIGISDDLFSQPRSLARKSAGTIEGADASSEIKEKTATVSRPGYRATSGLGSVLVAGTVLGFIMGYLLARRANR